MGQIICCGLITVRLFVQPHFLKSLAPNHFNRNYTNTVKFTLWREVHFNLFNIQSDCSSVYLTGQWMEDVVYKLWENCDIWRYH